MANVTNYKCPACTGPLHFVGANNRLECDYCGSSYEISEIDALYSEKVKEEAEKLQGDTNQEVEASESSRWGTEDMKAYNCPSCGAELICDETTVATSCPYCGNPTVIASQFKGGQMPDLVLPFKIDKKGAVEGLKNYYKGKIFLPDVFSKENHIEEIKGVYVPFWLFSGKTDAKLNFQTTNSNSHQSGDYMVVQTKHYEVERAAVIPYEKVPVDASVKMDDAQMDSIEPFDYSEIKPFSSSYLPGFFAETYDVSQEDCFVRCKTRLEKSACDEVEDQVKSQYETQTVTSKKIEIHNEKTEYAFLPVWLLSTKWKDQNYLFAMNGQTGKFVGNLPVDKRKVGKLFAKITVISTVILTAILTFIL